MYKRQVLGTSPENIEAQLQASWVKEDSFVPLKKMTQTQLNEPYVSPDGTSAGASIQDKLLGYPGVLITEAESRVYPYGESTAHLLGYVQQINAEELEKMKDKGYDEQSVIGKSGLEKLYEERLRAKEGYKIAIVDAEGKMCIRDREKGTV